MKIGLMNFLKTMTVAFAAFWTTATFAHEVRPAIGDLRIVDNEVELVLRLNAEAIIAGVDLDGVEDTDATEGAAAVDVLRTMQPEVITLEMQANMPRILDAVRLEADGAEVTLNVDTIDPDPVGDLDLPRETRLTLRATLAEGTQSVELFWPSEFGTLILRQQDVAEPFTGYLQGGEPSGPIAIAGGQEMTLSQAFLSYIPVGFDHILPLGLDHILFVLGLFFLSPKIGALLWQVSAFTLAHTVTLALGALGIVSVPGSIVEPLIAASIIYVAVENLFTTQLSRWRPLVIFGFGLLHGLGFASVLGDFGLPQDQFVAALIGFNIGVELGQLTVIAVAFLISYAVLSRAQASGKSISASAAYLVLGLVVLPAGLIPLTGLSADMFEAGLPLMAALALLAGFCANALVTGGEEVYRRMVALPASIIIALVGSFWVVERVFL